MHRSTLDVVVLLLFAEQNNIVHIRGHHVVEFRARRHSRRRYRLRLAHIHAGIDAVFALHVLVVVGPIGEMVIALDARVRSLAGVQPAMRL